MFKNISPGAIGIRGLNMQQSIELAKSTGWSGLDLNLREASALVQEHDVDYVLSLWSDAGLQMGGCGFPVNVRGSASLTSTAMTMAPQMLFAVSNIPIA